MILDDKEKVILNHYKEIIEKRRFDEYDILGFLIFIREKLDKGNFSIIPEFSDLIAHRHRNKGMVMNNICIAIKNNYQRENNKVKGYHGIKWETWLAEWKKIFLKFNIKFDKTIITEITLCIYSLAQNTTYNDGNGNIGKIELFIDNTTNSLCLCTTEGLVDSFYICFSKFGKFNINKSLFDFGLIKEIVETKRIEGKLILTCSKGIILEV